jgi:hypothetical protein
MEEDLDIPSFDDDSHERGEQDVQMSDYEPGLADSW